MSQEGRTIPDDRPPTPMERGEILSNMKRWARMGYEREVGSAEGFEQRWREAFHADEGAGED